MQWPRMSLLRAGGSRSFGLLRWEEERIVEVAC
jgi:hypothetical protein